MKIALIAAYIGKLPNYFNLWLKTCGSNQEISFFLVTDNEISANLIPANVTVINSDLPDLKMRFESVAGYPVSLTYAYKLCEFKPLYGLAFASILRGFDYWGYCDIDVLWGRILDFIPEDVDKYVRLFKRGHFCLHQNNELGNNLFRLEHPTVSARDALQSDSYQYLDEGGLYWICRQHCISMYDVTEPIGDFSYKKARLAISFFSLGLNRKHQAFLIEDGKAVQVYFENGEISRREFMYFHLQKRNFPDLREEDFEHVDSWAITARGFVAGPHFIRNVADLDRLNPPSYRHMVNFARGAMRRRFSKYLASFMR